MKIRRTFGRALPALVAVAMAGVAGGALAQSPPSGQAQPQATPQGDARDLLGRARSTNEGQMVEDLIKRLQGQGGAGAPAQATPPPTTAAPGPISPAVPAAPGASPPARVATPPRGVPPAPPTATARTPDGPPGGTQAAPSGAPGFAQPTPSTSGSQPFAATPPGSQPTQQAQPRSGRPPTASAPDAPTTATPTAAAPAAGPGAGPGGGPGAPLQAPLPDSAAAPGPGAAPPTASGPDQPVGGPTAVAAPGQPGQLPMSEAQVERMDALPNIDVEVLFFIESAQLTNRAFATLAILGRALADERLGSQVFLIAGHTDASGAADYNLALSERRAHAVRDFLIKNFGIAENRLLARGFGPSRLKVPQHPGSRLNRRVQVVNWTSEADPTAAAPAEAAPAEAQPQQGEPPQAAPPQQQPPRRRR